MFRPLQFFRPQKRALCVGIGHYSQLKNHDLKYAVADAEAIKLKLESKLHGQFDEVKCFITEQNTTKIVIENEIERMLNDAYEDDLVVIYFSCHGNVYGRNNTFYLLPSNASLKENGMPHRGTIIDIHDLAKTLTASRVKNIIFLLDACYSGGVGGVFQYLNLERDLAPSTNLFMIAAAQHDQVALQSSRLQHSIFTSCLLQAFEQRPKEPDGWITITDIHTFIAKEFKALEQQGIPTQIKCISASSNPSIPIIKNPHYSPESLKFYEEVKKLLQLVQYIPIRVDIPEKAPANFYFAEIKSGLRKKNRDRVGIIPYNNQVEPLQQESLERYTSFLKAQIDAGNMRQAMLVTSVEVTNQVKQIVESHSIEIETYHSIQKSLIDFENHLRHLIADYENVSLRDGTPPLDRIYVPLRAEFQVHERLDEKLSLLSERDMTFPRKPEFTSNIGWQGDAQEAVLRWLADPTSTRLALLADYGTGKTTFCRHVAATLARKHFEIGENQQYGLRIPLLIPLLDFSKFPVDLEGYMVAYLKKHCKVDNPDFEALIKMAEAGYLLFILDGFDEMASRASTDTIRQNITLFDQLGHIAKNKVFLTTRPEYFTSLGQEIDVLYSYDRLYLQLFDNKQIDLYLERRVPFITHIENHWMGRWQYYREQIDRIHDLSDLVRRPVLLEMIIKTLPTLIGRGEVINRPNLYQHYLEGELDRQSLKKRLDLQINRQKRFEIMEQLALQLHSNDRTEMPSSQIREISRELLTTEQQEEMDASLREIVTCSFLIRKNDSYRFSHESFLEYLVARRLASDISRDKVESFGQKPLNWTTLGFLLEFDRDFLRRSFSNFQAINTMTSFERSRLVDWFLAHRTKRWVGTNAISLLARLLPYDLLRELPLTGSDLTKVNLRGVDLRGVDLTRTNLAEADLTEADLRGANLTEANLTGARLGHSNLRGARLVKSSLINAKLELSELSHTDLRDADLRGAKLNYSSLIEADLQGADLRGADFNKAFLRGANFIR